MDSRPCIGTARREISWFRFILGSRSCIFTYGARAANTDGPLSSSSLSSSHIGGSIIRGHGFISGSIHRFPSYNCITRLIAHATYRGGT